MQLKTLFVSAIALAAGAQAASLTGSAKDGKYEVSVSPVKGSELDALISYKIDSRNVHLYGRGSIWTCKNVKGDTFSLRASGFDANLIAGCAAALAPNVAACASAVGQKFNPFAYATCFAQALNNKVNPPAACDNCYN
ncbi:hypothetical protein V5O48_008410 [Marasmius crinis-equi]|uniref:Uncharacterized protein n=1 Tax=Marasmius crinis-equi TaxID=585013 RepID=A0ABR3FDZ3_9AGAR